MGKILLMMKYFDSDIEDLNHFFYCCTSEFFFTIIIFEMNKGKINDKNNMLFKL